LQSSSSASTQNPANTDTATADNLTQELSDNDAGYSLPATAGHSAQEQDNPSSSATASDVSNPQEHNNDTATHQGNQTPIVAAGSAVSVYQNVEGIYDTLMDIFERASTASLPLPIGWPSSLGMYRIEPVRSHFDLMLMSKQGTPTQK